MSYPNWFVAGKAVDNFSAFLSKYKDTKVNFLQLGAYTGDATKWLFENVLTHPESTLIDVDTWEGSDEEAHEEFDWKSIEQTYDEKNKEWIDSGRLIKMKMTTKEFFKSNNKQFDFVYVDADHHAIWALRDGLDGYSCLKNGGILAFDDYKWGPELPKGDKPAPGIDAFLVCYANKTTVLERGLQVWLRKIF
jgi:predicted O-methyltransferase YrrM